MMASQKTVIRRVGGLLPPLNFLTLHYAYFILIALLWSVIFWASSEPARSVTYTDSLFLCVSAMTGAGLNTVNISVLNTFQQSVLFGLILLGHPILISSTVLFVRKRAFETKFRGIAEEHARRISSIQKAIHLPLIGKKKHKAAGVDVHPDRQNVQVHQGVRNPEETADPQISAENRSVASEIASQDIDAIRWVDDDQITISPSVRERNRHRIFPMAGVGARPDAKYPRDAVLNLVLDDVRRPSIIGDAIRGTRKYFLSRGFISRNSQFYGLTPAERDRLGGVEYKAISFLSIVVPLYFVLFNIFGLVGIGAWIAVNKPDVARVNGLDPFWTGAFFAVSAFGNNGMSLLDVNMTALQTSVYVLLTMAFLILAGNTLYPCFLRLNIWAIRRILPRTRWFDDWRNVLDFILDHPRRVYTHLFPRRHTWYLLCTVILLNGIDWAGFELLSIGNNDIQSLGPYRIIDGLFQAFAVRSGGFYVVTIADLHQGLLVLYVLMMYVSAFPVLLTIRNTNVYEERSLGIYATDNLAEDQRHHASLGNVYSHIKSFISSFNTRERYEGQRDNYADENDTSRSYFIRQQLRSQLSHDIWWICLAVLFITIAEGPSYSQDPVTFSTFNIIFEVVSAYGCVGITVGLPDQNYSFSGAWHVISKLILVAVMLRGRHRGLPVAIDKAVMLPDESLAWAEEEDAATRLERSRTFNLVHDSKKNVDMV
ncbi:putative potassium transporter [Talaromyces proteolyticus]|uniref:Potassium transport protein n=1 Tax=Talaromyces proteolyticus TaxID=1131652 RepID=A0AAD4Q1E5_9EURO|nr:putative potassium transporter [Talaromyces proteolyticus]KAH8698639.1 putative potassium transporter [Talaromyces proteolyticus]